MQANATIQLEHAACCIKALCKHFSCKIETSHNDNTGHIVFPYGECTLTANDDTLHLVATADHKRHLQQVQYMIVSHLERCAQTSLSVEWEEV